ncbi:Tetrahydroberberine oxidase [Linum perenne]
MGEDVFWAIRGGGASSFGIVVSWKLKWQQFAHDVHEDLFVRTMILGLKRTNTETQMYKAKFKAKSDFVTDPVPEFGLEGMWKLAVEEELSIIILEPLGGRMKEIPESYTPFPHRIGHLYNIQYLVKWEEDNDEEEEKRHIEWMKKLYDYMEAYVSKSPRAAYLNYRDLDIGTNNVDERKTSFMEASVWGKKYFRDNFIKLCKAKTMIDPHNFFSHEQSIPLFH